jgi:hypothetical protein
MRSWSGDVRKKNEIIRKLLRRGDSPEDVADIVMADIAEVQRIKAELNIS